MEQFATDINITKLIAKGGMGEVYLGIQTGAAGFQKKIAVKRIYKHLASKKSFRAMFEREVNLSSRLQHPNIIQIIKAEETPTCLYYVMEYVRGKHVAELIERAIETDQEIPLAMICFVMLQVAKGLSYAHSLIDEITGEPLELVHRDISPANIMMSFNGAVKVVDFGIAKAANSLDLTKVGVLKGKFKYLAPERIINSACDNRSDLFSLGIVFYEMIAREHLFNGEASAEIIDKIAKYKAPRLNLLPPEVPDSLKQILAQLLDPNPETRYQSADQLEVDLINELNNLDYSFTEKNFRELLSDFFPEETFNQSEVFVKENYAPSKTYIKKLSASLHAMIKPHIKTILTQMETLKGYKRTFLSALAGACILATIGFSYQANIFSKIYHNIYGIPEASREAASSFKNQQTHLLASFGSEAILQLEDSNQWHTFKITPASSKHGLTLFIVADLPSANDNSLNVINLIDTGGKSLFRLSVFKSSLLAEIACGESTCFATSDQKLKSGDSVLSIKISNNQLEVFQNQDRFITQSLRENKLLSNDFTFIIGKSQDIHSNSSQSFGLKELAIYKMALTEQDLSEAQNFLAVEHNIARAIPKKYLGKHF